MIARYSTRELTSLWSEAERYRTWLLVELAAVQAWEALGEVPEGTHAALAAQAAAQPLDEAFAERVATLEAETKHDIVAFTRALSERYGPEARFIHLGLTSTDVVDTAQNLLLVRALDLIQADVEALMARVREIAIEHQYTPTIGRTHGIHAEPMTFGLKFLNFMAALQRDLTRLKHARASVGVAMLSGSVGTYAHVPPAVEAHVAAALGLAVDPVTNQTVARDRHADMLNALALLGTTLERIALEIRHLQRSELREAQEGFGVGQTGSSSMPHKKNPIASENIAGVARMLRAYAQTGLENVALWHERDISHSAVERVTFPDATQLASYATRRMTSVLRDLIVRPERMLENMDALRGLVFSQRVLHALIEHGMSREAAYTVVQRASLQALDTGEHLRDILAQNTDCPLTETELAAAFDAGWYLRHVDAIYKRFGL